MDFADSAPHPADDEEIGTMRLRATHFIPVAAMLLAVAAKAEPIKVGTLAVAGLAAPFIAQERGYFASAGVPAELVLFDAAQPVAVAVVAGAIDFGVAAATAGLYNLAAQGELRIIAAAAHEFPGFQIQAFLAATRAGATGVKSLKDLPGHSFAVTGMGAPPVYVVGSLVAAKYGFDYRSIKFVSMSTIPNVVSAIAGGQVDATVSSLTTQLAPLVQRRDVRLLGWVGDETPWQYGVVITSTKTADTRRPTVERFLAAYRKAARDYHDAFTGAGEKRQDGPTAPDILAILSKHIHQSVAEIRLAIPYLDANARLDAKDVRRQVDWYKSQGLVKGPVEADAMIDMHYVVPAPDR
jgi:NitT/TauT family transport system substrate-binding protein